MRPVVQRLVIALLAMAVGLSLVQGRTLGYLCDCGDAARLVPVPDCHQVECHPDHAHADGCDDTTELPSGGADHSHDHPAVQDQPDGTGSDPGSVAAPVTVAVPIRGLVRIALPATETPARVPVGSCIPPPPRRTFLNSVLLI